MKYSARLVTALAAIALLVVAIVGLSTKVQATHEGGNTHATGTIFLTNDWSMRTTETPAPTGRTYIGSGNTLYSTFVEQNSAGTAQSTIETDADVLTITVVDTDKNLSVSKSATSSIGALAAGASTVVFLPLADSPIIDTDGDGNFIDEVTLTGTGVGVSNVNPGDGGTVAANVTVSAGAAGSGAQTITLAWKTSSVDVLTGKVKVTSTQDSTGITLDATETGRNTGRFEVKVTLVDVENAANVSTSTAPAKIRIQHGGIVTVEYSDDSVPGTPAGAATTPTKVTASATVETAAPSVTVTGPAHNSATQQRRPTFSGSVSDSSSGIKTNRTFVYIDDEADKDSVGNQTVAVTVTVAGEDQNIPTLGTGAADGQSSVTFSFTPSGDLPAGGLTSVDHKVDWQVRATDLAGNIGYSDSDGDPSDNLPGVCPAGTGTACAPGEGSPAGRGAPHVVRIDNTIPNIVEAFTGHFWDTTLATPALAQNKATSIEVLFDGPVDPATVAITDFEVTVSGATQVPTVAEVFTAADAANSVFLTVTALAANATPTVKVSGQVSDTAGNTAAAGALSKVAKDSLGPTLTVTLSDGSSATKPTTLSKDSMKITVTSDEPLAGDPLVEIYVADGADAGTDPDFEKTVAAINQGGNTWVATFTKGGSPDSKKSVYVTGTDAASVASRTSPSTGASTSVAPSSNTKGKKDPADSAAITFTLDSTAPTVGLVTAGTLTQTTDERQPFIVIAFSEAVTTINKATLDDVDISGSLAASTDKKNYIHKPTADMTIGAHKVIVSGTDEAGNKLADTTLTLTVSERKAFELPLKPGWNLVSLRSPPADTSINSVVTVADVSTVITYDPSATGGPWFVATRGTDGKLTGSLTTMDALHGYWINTTSFEPIKVLDPKPQGGSLPPAIPVSAGWNLIPARDITGTLTAGTEIAKADKYFTGTKVTRVYKFDTLTGVFVQLVLTGTTPSGILVGEAYWAYFNEAGAVVP